MARPDDFTLFAQYHLGLLPDGQAQFSNLGDVARRYGAGVEEVKAWLAEAQIDAATADDTDYDLPGQHAEAQVLAMLGDAAATLAFAHKVYDEYRARLGHKRVRTFADDDNDKTVSDKVHISDVPRKT
ncbi:MAG TPA: hypothetical protein VHB97_20250 [Polyangia bacterium]|jgi:hypothetical protein|nr:hypothetical protein [Polyangia bacterium]